LDGVQWAVYYISSPFCLIPKFWSPISHWFGHFRNLILLEFLCSVNRWKTGIILKSLDRQLFVNPPLHIHGSIPTKVSNGRDGPVPKNIKSLDGNIYFWYSLALAYPSFVGMFYSEKFTIANYHHQNLLNFIPACNYSTNTNDVELQ
jgi:hypothetical protein